MTQSLFARLCDDAATFPPGSLRLEEAVPAHVRHRQSRYAELVGPLVVSSAAIEMLAGVVTGLPDVAFDLALTVPGPERIAEAVAAAQRVPAARLVMLEVAVPDGTGAGDVVLALEKAAGPLMTFTVFVEVPRDGRREALLQELAGTGYFAKFRTGGVRADLFPDEAELAGVVLAAVRAGVPFKATAGLHHALRNTDPQTGFEQHGFLNLLSATGAALDGADHADLVVLLADRDGACVANRVRSLSPHVREAFRSFGTCSIVEPVDELAGLGLLNAETTKGVL